MPAVSDSPAFPRMPFVMKAKLLLRYRPWFTAAFQAVLVCCSLVLAWLLRFDFTLPERRTLLIAIPLLVLMRLTTMPLFGLLRGWWRYTGPRDVVDVLLAVASGSTLFCLAMRTLPVHNQFARSIFIMEALLTAGLLIGVRLLSRVLAQSMREDIAGCKRVIVIGAGTAAQTLLREINRPGSGYVALGCLDDDPTKRRIRVQNVPVLGSVTELSRVLRLHPADEVLIAVPSASNCQMRRFVEACTSAKIKFRTMPTLKDILAGHVNMKQLREVRVEDLLGRNPVNVDLTPVRRVIEGSSVLVTGAAGFIGSELCRQILACTPSRLVCLDQSETALFYLRQELMANESGERTEFVLADVCDRRHMRNVLAEHAPTIIFHAAAYKHVPLMEGNVHEAVRNNVLGLLDLLEVAEESGTHRFVLISSDKAVNPTSVMGASKRIGELILSSRPIGQMSCVSVRFGNVLGSSGSVVPVLQEQLRRGCPLTITHPGVTRFFMTAAEAVALVLQAAAIGKHGDVLVLDMGEPVRILDLARGLLRLSGKTEEEVEIRFTGLRPGEKFTEELFYADEIALPTACEKISRTQAPARNWPSLRRYVEELRQSLSLDGAAPVRAKIKQIVPEYCPAPDPPLTRTVQPPPQLAVSALASD